MNRIWSLAGKTTGSLLLFMGGTISTGILAGMGLSHVTGTVLPLLTVLLVFFGVAPLSLGGWLLQLGFKAEQQARRDRFFQLLQQNQGRLSVLDFAAATRLEPASARRQLDRWATEFSANFEVSEVGDVYYVFPTQHVVAPPSQTSQLLNTLMNRLERAM